MIAVFDIETGEILERRGAPAAPNRTRSQRSPIIRLPQPALQEAPAPPPAVRMPPDLAHLDIAEALARYR